MGVEEAIDDVSVFFTDTFYIQFFQSAFPDFDFSALENTDDEEQMAANIQSLIDLLSSKILMYDLGHIQGEEIVNGNPEHCINLLQLVKEISGMMNTNSNVQASGHMYDDGDDQDENQDSDDKQQFHPEGAEDMDQLEMDEDEEAQEISGRQHQRNQSDKEVIQLMDQQLDEFDDQDDQDDGQDEEDEGDHQYGQLEPDDQENEVSINIEDAIATAEEINQQNNHDNMH